MKAGVSLVHKLASLKFGDFKATADGLPLYSYSTWVTPTTSLFCADDNNNLSASARPCRPDDMLSVTRGARLPMLPVSEISSTFVPTTLASCEGTKGVTEAPV